MKKGTLATFLGLSTSILRAYERGAKTPSEATVDRIAERLEFPREFFDGDDLDEPSVEGTSFRSLRRLTSERRERALAAATLALMFSDWIDANFETPEADVPHYGEVPPEMAADGVRNEWGLGERPVPNTISLLESRGIRVFSLSEDCLELDAFSFMRAGRPIVFLNTKKSAERSRMDAAHELGHLVLHATGALRGQGRQTELDADRFASAFLMPRRDVMAHAPRYPSIPNLIAAKKRWGVSLAALTYRMHELGLLSEWQYRTLFIEISRSGFRRLEPNGGTPETSRLLQKLFDILKLEGQSQRDVAAELAIPVDELRRMIFGLALTPVDGSSTARFHRKSHPNHLRAL